MSAKKLKIIDVDIIELNKDISNDFSITINGQVTFLKCDQAHLLMLWLQEHLKK